MKERQFHFPFSCRDDSHLVDIAVAHEMKLENKVYWKSEKKEKDAEVVHYAHAFNGGVEINENVNRLDFLNFKNMLLTMQLIATSALNREESLGSHYRIDSVP